MLSTFILNPKISISQSTLTEVIPVCNGIEETENLKMAIKWAQANDEDVMFCVLNDTDISKFETVEFDNIIVELAREGIFTFYVDAVYEEEFRMNEFYKVISQVKQINSFIITRPLYKFLLAFLNEKEVNNFTLSFLLIRISLHSIALNLEKSITFPKTEVSIKIISPFRNVSNYITECIESITKQDYDDYRVYFVDDQSEDGSSSLIPDNPKFKKYLNTSRNYALKNIIKILLENEFEDEDVICIIDADDRLPHKYVFNILNDQYSKSSTLLTYGTMGYLSGLNRFGGRYMKEDFDEIRKKRWKVSQLRTFKYKVFKEILKQDPEMISFKDSGGDFLKMPYDMALLFPLLEICGYDRVKYIDAILYEYRLHGNNDQYVNRSEQYKGELEIRKKKMLRPVF